ncbi:MAG: Hsp33 family molecular chaperone [Caulobacterales bacterium 68-7]|nr:Hsp33 family molecular chaperone [Caulobacterales bacterium]OJU08785.1 MAG: Hsp33 family molecular chaperone [Caulobacterales bacterium 68-7]
MTDSHTSTPPADDLVAAFQIEDMPVRGRIARLSSSIDQVLAAHEYPDAVANLLGEACALAALVGSALKSDGRMIVQAQGNGPVSYVVADYDATGALRGYCRFDPERIKAMGDAVGVGFSRPGARDLLGEGVFIMTVDPGEGMERYQGVTPIEGETLALCAEQYFTRSEQTPTRIRLAIGQVDTGEGANWRAGGILLQYIAGDDARGSTDDDWTRAQALFETTGEDELIDPTVTTPVLLYRLFHEDGARMFEPKPVRAFCKCSPERIEDLLRSFSPAERADMVEPDGSIKVTCEYCSRSYSIEPATLEG